MKNELWLGVCAVVILSGNVYAGEGVAAKTVISDSIYKVDVDDRLAIGDGEKFKDYKLDTETNKSGTIVFGDYDSVTEIGNGVEFSGNENINGLGGAIYNNGTLNFNGDALFENNSANGNANDIYNKNEMYVNAGTLTIGSGINGSGNLTVKNGATLDIGTSTVTQNTAAFEEGSTLALKINSADEYGRLIVTNGLESAGANLKATIAQGVFDAANANKDGLSFQLISGDVNDQFNNSFSNAMYSFEGDGSGNYTVKQIATAADLAGKENPGLSGAAEAWTDNGGFGNKTQQDMAEHLNELAQNNPEAYKKALQSLTPENSHKIQFATSENTDQVFGAVGSRLSGGCGFYCTGNEGRSSGDEMFQRSMVWTQGLYNKAKLSRSDGFDAKSSGVAMGAEHYFDLSSKIGFGYAYTNTDIDSLGRETEVDTHTLFLYGEYKPSRWFVNGIAGYSLGRYDESQYNGNRAKYDVNSFSLQAMSGYDFVLGNYTLVPQAGLRYTNSGREAYTDSLFQRISSDDADILTATAGIKLSTEIAVDSCVFLKPELKLAATYDLFNDGGDAQVTLSNGSVYTINGRALDRLGFEAGIGIAAELNDSTEVALGYEGKFRQDYRDHSGLVNYKYKF